MEALGSSAAECRLAWRWGIIVGDDFVRHAWRSGSVRDDFGRYGKREGSASIDFGRCGKRKSSVSDDFVLPGCSSSACW